MLLLLIVFFVFSTCTVLLEYYAVQYYYRLREARQGKRNDDHCKSLSNETPAKSSVAPALMETPTGSEGGDEIPRAITCPSSRHVSVSAAPRRITSETNEDVVSSQTIRKKETLPLPDGSVQTIIHIRNRSVLNDGSVKETVTVKVLEEDGSVETEMEQTTSNVYHPAEESRRIDEEFEGQAPENSWNTPKKTLHSSPYKKFVPEGLLQPLLSPKNKRQLTRNCKQLMPYYTITEDPQILLAKNKFSEPKVAMDRENAVVVCKQSVHFFEHDKESWKEINTVSMPHVYCTMSVAISGNTAVVGVPKDSSGVDKVTTGVVYIYEKQNGQWKEVSKFLPPSNESDNYRGANVGYAVDIDEDTIVIGAPSKDSITRNGSVFVLKRCQIEYLTDGWVQHSQLKMNPLASHGKAGKDYFGSIVSIRKGVIAVSDGGETVAVFQYKPDVNSYIPKKGSLIDDANKGKSCASLALTSDGGILVGCESRAADSGALFYHVNHPGPSAGQYILHQSLGKDDEDNLKNKNQRCQVSVNGSSESQIMIMGMTAESNRAHSKVKIYKRSNECWNQVAAVESNSDYGTIFGSSLAISKNQIMIASSNNVYAYNLEI
ncbi:hypothetical protein ACHAXN_002281 [Cyclotella atomus]